MIHVVSGLALGNGGGVVLLGQRARRSRRGGLWETPGGKVDEGETPRAALVREWKEELNVDITAGEHIATASFDIEIEFTVDLFLVTARDGFYTLDRRVHDDLCWVSLHHAAEYMPCSPALYVHYPQIRRWLKERGE